MEVEDHELQKAVQKWSQHCVDVDALQRRALHAEETCRMLSKKIYALQSQLQKFQLEKKNSYNVDEQTVNHDATPTKAPSNAEDEGISSSERSSSPENTKLKVHQDNDQETTIDEVIEELRIIVKDAEEEYESRNREDKEDLYEVPKPRSTRNNKTTQHKPTDLNKVFFQLKRNLEICLNSLRLIPNKSAQVFKCTTDFDR